VQLLSIRESKRKVKMIKKNYSKLRNDELNNLMIK